MAGFVDGKLALGSLLAAALTSGAVAATPAFDAPSIVVVRIEAAAPGPWRFVERTERQRHVALDLVVERVLRGPLHAGEQLKMNAEQSEAVGRFAAVGGAWSGKTLEKGGRYLIFARTPTDVVRVAAPSQVVDVELALDFEKSKWPLSELARRAGPKGKLLGPLFAEYLAASLPAAVGRGAEGWGAVAEFLESADLAPAFRAAAATAAVDAVLMHSPAPDAIVARTALMAFRLLSLPEQPGFHDRLVRASLPNLLGFEGSEPARAADVIFAAHGVARAQAATALAALPASEPRARLENWLSLQKPQGR